MAIGRIRCALGRHRVDQRTIKTMYGREVGRCKCCSQVLEQEFPGVWIVTPVRDAGLGYRAR